MTVAKSAPQADTRSVCVIRRLPRVRTYINRPIF